MKEEEDVNIVAYKKLRADRQRLLKYHSHFLCFIDGRIVGKAVKDGDAFVRLMANKYFNKKKLLVFITMDEPSSGVVIRTRSPRICRFGIGL